MELPPPHIFSRSETNEKLVQQAMDRGQNVAVVFGGKPNVRPKDRVLPKTWRGRRVIDGDDSDLRFLDPKNIVVGLLAKGKGKRDTTGFVLYDTNLSELISERDSRLKRGAKPTGIGRRMINRKVHVPIQQNVSRARARDTASRIRGFGRNARVVQHAGRDGYGRPTGRKKFAVYTQPITGACPT